MVRSRSAGLARRRPTQVFSLTRAAASVAQAVQNDAVDGHDAVRARSVRRALVACVAVVAMSGW